MSGIRCCAREKRRERVAGGPSRCGAHESADTVCGHGQRVRLYRKRCKGLETPAARIEAVDARSSVQLGAVVRSPLQIILDEGNLLLDRCARLNARVHGQEPP
eukprot:3187254-Prymnesium_polylepis.2